jgi:S1-C subfamily serine protease
MRSFLISLGLSPAVAAFLCLAALAADVNLDAVDAQILAPTVQLNRNCSGQVVYSKRDEKTGKVTTYVLTAKHCIEDVKGTRQTVNVPVYADSVVVKWDAYFADIVGASYRRDLALLKLTDANTILPTAKVAKADTKPRMGEPTITAGYPAALELLMVEGRFGGKSLVPFNFSHGNEEVHYFRATATIAGGNSGGGLYRLNAGTYELIGVTDAIYGGQSFMGFYVPVDEIARFLTETDAVAFPKPAVTAATAAPVVTAPKAGPL